jgi:hypothetical protein
MELEKPEKHFKKPPKKPWVLEVSVTWPEDSKIWVWPGQIMTFKSRYSTEKAAKQAEPSQVGQWTKYTSLTVTSKIYKK